MTAARVVILNKGKILLIHRLKYGREYFVLPGGAIEKGENPKQAVIREAKEETNFNIEVEKLLWKFNEKVKNKKRLGYYFLAKSFKGKLKLCGPEAKINSKDNKYLLEWTSLSKLKHILIYPKGIKQRILRRF